MMKHNSLLFLFAVALCAAQEAAKPVETSPAEQSRGSDNEPPAAADAASPHVLAPPVPQPDSSVAPVIALTVGVPATDLPVARDLAAAAAGATAHVEVEMQQHAEGDASDSGHVPEKEAGAERDVLDGDLPTKQKRLNPRRTGLGSGLNPYEEKEPWAGAKHEAEEGHVPSMLPTARKGASAKKPLRTPEDRGGAAGGEPEEEVGDDYYGLNINHAYHLDPQAFQPSHTLEFVIQPGTTELLFEDLGQAEVGKVVRGDWYVTSGDVLNARVSIYEPTGASMYSEGPENADWDGEDPERAFVSEGSFKFVAQRAGTYKIEIENPSSSYERSVAFAWLVGRDDDDPFVSKDDAAKASAGGNVTSAVYSLKRQASHLHKKIDELVAMVQYADVRFKRHHDTVESTNSRVFRYTLVETAAVLASMLLSILFVRRLDIKSGQTMPRPFSGV
jgi:hypothetical protein